MTAPPAELQTALAAFVLGLVALLMGHIGSFAWFWLLSMAALTLFLSTEEGS